LKASDRITGNTDFMDQKPWHQNEHLDPSFPFHLWDAPIKNFPFHWHELLEIIYILEGNISISVGGEKIQTQKGDIVIINSNTIHGFFNGEPGTLVAIFQFGLGLFDKSLVDLRDRAVQKLVFDRKIFVSRTEEKKLHQKLERLLLNIRQEYYKKEEGFCLAIKSGLYKFALVFLRELPPVASASKETAKLNHNRRILERVFSYIHGNYGNTGITLERAAEVAALSKFHFSRFFRDQTGQTFHIYLSQVRINQAKELLIESDLSITEIAYICGLSSVKTFNRLFKTFTDVSPSTYRSGKKQFATEGSHDNILSWESKI
jgi:AraC-like DNA-binding protein/uncharacterized cupin superfamily protein